jgi:glycosyltransferase involved in cell wall biosynthesis
MAMKVCIVTPDFPLEASGGRGGVATYSEMLARALAELQVEVHVVIYGDSRPVEPLKSNHANHLYFVQLWWIRYFSSWFPGVWQSLQLARFLRRLDRQHHFSLFEMYNDEGITFFPLLLFRNRTAFRMHSSLRQHVVHKGEAFNRGRRFSVWFDRMAALIAQHLVTHSEFHSDEMASEYGIERSRFHIISHGTRPEAVEDSPAVGTAVAYIGSLDRRKGIDVFLDAAPIILRLVPSANLLVIGRDGGFSKDRSWKQWFEDTYGNDQRITFTGSVSDKQLSELWTSIDNVAVPSRYESFGLTVIEGFSRAKAVVTTRAGALPEVAGDGAILVEPANSEELAQAVVSLLEDPARGARIRSAGYQRYLQSYTPEIFAGRIMKLYQEIAEASKG